MEESQSNSPASTRRLREEERALLECLLKEANSASFVPTAVDGLMVEEMADGGMGSVQFVKPDKPSRTRRMLERIAEKEFLDVDGVPILVSLNVDEDREIFELDIWKADFSSVRRFPRC